MQPTRSSLTAIRGGGGALLSLTRHSEELLTQTLYTPVALSPLLYFFWNVLSWTSTIYFLSTSKRVCAQRFLSLSFSLALSILTFNFVWE